MTANHDTPEAVERMVYALENSDCYQAAAMLLRLHQRALDAERERDGANALVERMHAQDVLAIQSWQKVNPGNDLLWPDHMRLTAWCMGSVAQLVAERDAAIREIGNTARLVTTTARNAALREAAAFCSLRGYQQIAANLVDLAEKEPRHD